MTGFYDSNGIPIYSGDLLRIFHFRDRRRRQKRYLYHVVCGDVIQPVSWLDPATDQSGGGSCSLRAIATGDLAAAEIIHGNMIKDGDKLIAFYERPRRLIG